MCSAALATGTRTYGDVLGHWRTVRSVALLVGERDFLRRSRPPEDWALGCPGGCGAGLPATFWPSGVCVRLTWRPQGKTSDDSLGHRRTVRSAALRRAATLALARLCDSSRFPSSGARPLPVIVLITFIAALSAIPPPSRTPAFLPLFTSRARAFGLSPCHPWAPPPAARCRDDGPEVGLGLVTEVTAESAKGRSQC